MKIYKVYCTYEESDCDNYEYWEVESQDEGRGGLANSYHLTEEGAQAQLQKIKSHERWGHYTYVWKIREITLEP